MDSWTSLTATGPVFHRICSISSSFSVGFTNAASIYEPFRTMILTERMKSKFVTNKFVKYFCGGKNPQVDGHDLVFQPCVKKIISRFWPRANCSTFYSLSGKRGS